MAKVEAPTRTGFVEIHAAKNGYIVFPQRYEPGCFYPRDTQLVFADFASLTAWLRKNITHGNGVEA